ncbi:MAG: ABC transporter ATP-binding protein [Candidatus Heimdallarchaeota archaeon]
MNLLEIHDLYTFYMTEKGPIRACDGVDLIMDRGQALGVAGESGCGKTTMALSIIGLLPMNGRVMSGEILFKGENLVGKTRKELKKIRWSQISMIFQGAMNALNPVIKISDQIEEAIMTHQGSTPHEARERASELFELMGLDIARIDHYPHEFSGGMKQRALIAMALACDPELVIADEPTTALDVVITGQILTLIKKIQSNLELSMMVISHDLSALGEICDRIAIMYAGKLVELGDTVDLFAKPLHPYAKGLIGAFIPLDGARKTLKTIPGVPPDLLHPPSGCRFHPRCPLAEAICSQKEPILREVGKDRWAACHLM